MEKVFFGKTSWGKDTYKYYLENKNGMRVAFTDMGACVMEVWVKDKAGTLRDVVLGYDDVLSYEKSGTYFGAIVGRYANRIAGARFELNGREYCLEQNDHENSLHSGSKGMARKVWDVVTHEKTKIVFHCVTAEDDFPGTASCDVTYELTDENALCISYDAVCDEDSPFNMTNHAYFNLNGHDGGNVLEHQLMIRAAAYTPLKPVGSIPTGEIADVVGTPFDFRVAKPIGRDIDADFAQIRYGSGYDHNFVIEKQNDGMEKFAEAYSEVSGIVMEAFTDCVGVQLYTGNFVNDPGKHGVHYDPRAGFCLETQFFPNAINEPTFLSPVVRAGEHYRSQTVYRFSTK